MNPTPAPTPAPNPNPTPTRTRTRTRLVVAALTVLTSVVLVAGPAHGRTASGTDSLSGGASRSTPATCQGREATIVGEPGEDVDGTAFDDVIVAIGPDIEVWANGGHDLVCVFGPAADRYGHGGYNQIYLGPGNDTVITYAGGNDIFGHDGHDRAYLNGGSEWTEMGEGDDVVWALGAESVAAYGGPGWDVLIGSPGEDHLFGEDGYDVLLGADGDDVLVGGTGNDLLFGNAGWDLLDGDEHFDECRDHQGPQGADVQNCETVILSPAAPLPEAAA